MVQLSPVVGVPRLTPVATQLLLLAETFRSGGQMIVGGWRSRTMTVCGQLEDLPHWSVTVQVTVLMPTGKVGGALLVTTTLPHPMKVTVGGFRTKPETEHTFVLAMN